MKSANADVAIINVGQAFGCSVIALRDAISTMTAAYERIPSDECLGAEKMINVVRDMANHMESVMRRKYPQDLARVDRMYAREAAANASRN